MIERFSPLHVARLRAGVRKPRLLDDLHRVVLEKGAPSPLDPQVAPLFSEIGGQPAIRLAVGAHQDNEKKRVGVVLSGGQAAGGHNVIGGLFDGLKRLNGESELIGFVGGPSGIVDGETVELTAEVIDQYRNIGGFDMIGSGRTKIESEEQLKMSLETVRRMGLDALVVIGGDDSNTNAAVMAEYFARAGQETAVVGVPKTIDGDLKNEQIPISFGHDTACRVYSELIGNLMRDCLSARKYYHFVKLMGRSASHIALECALQTHPNVVLIGEEVAAKEMTLREITEEICTVIRKRAEAGKHYGVILIPEGLIEFIPEMGKLIDELNGLLAAGKDESSLSGEAKATFASLPKAIAEQLLIDRDPHGNVQVSRIETERLLMATVAEGMGEGKFNAVHHFFGYEGRAGFPTLFDAEYCYALGLVAARLAQGGATGYMAAVQNLTRPAEEWTAAGVPITSLLVMEIRHGKPKPVIEKALVELDAKPFAELEKHRKSWAKGEHYRYPGPIQFSGDAAVTEELSLTLALEG